MREPVEPMANESVRVDLALFTVRLSRLTEEMESLIGAGLPDDRPAGARAVLGGIFEVAAAPLALLGLTAALLVAVPPLGGLALLGSWGLWLAVWQRSERSGIAEGERALQVFDEVCPPDHPLIADDPELQRERAALRPPQPAVGLSVELHDPLTRLARAAAWLAIAALQVGASLVALLGPGLGGDTLVPMPLIGLALAACTIAGLVIIHDLDIAVRAGLLPGVARTSGESLLFLLHCQRLAARISELDLEAARLGLPPLQHLDPPPSRTPTRSDPRGREAR